MRLLIALFVASASPMLAAAQERPEPFLLLEVSRDCATAEEDEILADEIRLRMPAAFVIRGSVAGVEPDWRVKWRPLADGTCELVFSSTDNTSSMTLGPAADAPEIQLAASRVAWLASVSRPRDGVATVPSDETSLDTPFEEPPTEEPPPEEPPPEEPPQEEPPPEDPVEADELQAEDLANEVAPPPEFYRISSKVSVLPSIVVWPTSLPERDVPSLSLNLIGGSNHGLDGFEAGLVWNREVDFARGGQVAMGANFVGGDARLIQLALGLNVVGGNQRGLSAAIGANVVGSANGVLGAGGANLVDGDFEGVAVALGLNTAERTSGAQLAVGGNIATGPSDAVQMAIGFNLARQLTGIQVALVNVAGPVDGLQLGIVNVAETTDLSLGLVNVLYGEPLYVSAWATNAVGAVVGLQHGGTYLRYSYLVGFDPANALPAWKLGAGLGGHVPLRSLFLDSDFFAFWKVPFGRTFDVGSAELELKGALGWQFARRFAVFGGASLHALYTGLIEGAGLAPDYATNLSQAQQAVQIFGWPEVHLGVRF